MALTPPFSLLFFAALLALLPTNAVAALAPLERNLAYRSPSLTVNGNGLSHDIDAIGRTVLRRRSQEDYPSSAADLRSAKGGHAADQVVSSYDGKYGSDGRDAYQGKVTFPYGVASGDPYDDSAILWTNVQTEEETQDPVCLFYQVSTGEQFAMRSIVDSGYAWTTSEVDYSLKVETSGLRPLTKYHYRFYACHDHSIVSPYGQFKTIPEDKDSRVDKVKLAVFSCSNLPFGYFHAYRQAALTEDVDLAVHVGDYFYESAGDGSPDAYGDGRSLDRVPLPNKEIFTLDDYRQRYKSYRKDADLQLLHARKAWVHVWDDHEVADNAYNHGTADSNNTAAGTVDGVNFTERKRNAVKAFFEWMPIRQVDTTDGLRIWRKFHYGKLANLFMLDTRQYDRDLTDVYYNTEEVARLSNSTNRSLMGGKQERWFYRNLVEAQQQGFLWKIVGQQIVVSHLHNGAPGFDVNYDAWDGYKANRRRMFDTITSNKIDNTILLAGDSHASWVFDTVYEEWENKTEAYDPSTGRGAIAVEFAGTAVSSPSSYGSNLSLANYTTKAERLVRINRNLQYADGAKRGYFTLALRKSHATAEYWGFDDIRQANQSQVSLSTFRVNVGENHLARPINGGKGPKSGALQGKTVDYAKEKWNGTAFA